MQSISCGTKALDTSERNLVISTHFSTKIDQQYIVLWQKPSAQSPAHVQSRNQTCTTSVSQSQWRFRERKATSCMSPPAQGMLSWIWTMTKIEIGQSQNDKTSKLTKVSLTFPHCGRVWVHPPSWLGGAGGTSFRNTSEIFSFTSFARSLRSRRRETYTNASHAKN